MTGKHHTDPDIQAEYNKAIDELEKRIRPYMQDHLVHDLAREFIADMSAHGWRPPLRPAPDWLLEGRRRADRSASPEEVS